MSVTMMKGKAAHKKHRPSSQPQGSIIGRIRHEWKDGDEPLTQWNGSIVDQIPVSLILYLTKYDGFDCVYVKLHRDENVSSLEALPNRIAT